MGGWSPIENNMFLLLGKLSPCHNNYNFSSSSRMSHFNVMSWDVYADVLLALRFYQSEC